MGFTPNRRLWVGGAIFVSAALCCVAVPFLFRLEAVTRRCFAAVARYQAVVAVGMALLQLHFALSHSDEELEERLRNGLRPTARVCAFYVAVAFGAMLGSRPTEQLSLGERRLCLSLVVGVTLAADLTQARRLGDARFLFLWGSFHAPMGLSLWACSAGGAAKAKALASKLTLAGVEA